MSEIYVVDDNPGVLDAIKMLLRSVGQSCRPFSSAADFLREYDGAGPACLILDVRMPGMSGLALQQELSARGIRIPIIFLTGHGDVQLAVRAMRAGAYDFFEKPFNDHDLLDSINGALKLDADLRSNREESLVLGDRLRRLTQREKSVFDLLCAGKSNEEIAGALSLSVRTVEGYRSRILAKLEVRSFLELLRQLKF